MPELDGLAEEIVSWAGHLAAGTARWLGMISRFDVLEGFARYGCQSTAHWLNWACALGLRSAREVRVARRLEDLPLIRQTFERGELLYSKVRAMTRVATAETEADLVMLATHSTAAHIEKIVAAIRLVAEHASTDPTRVRGSAGVVVVPRRRRDAGAAGPGRAGGWCGGAPGDQPHPRHPAG